MSTPTRTPVTVVRRSGGGRRARTPLVPIDQTVLQFISQWATAKDAGTLRDKARDQIKAWFAKGGDTEHDISVNDNGSQLLEFEEVKEINGRKVAGVENRRTATSVLDPDAIDEWLEELPQAQREKLSKQLYTKVTEYVLNPDELFALNQQGVIPDEVLDSFYKTNTTWSLNVVLA
jgi:hypothetical protein